MGITSTDSRPISRLSFLDLLGQDLDAPIEWSEAYLSLDLPVDGWKSARLTCNGRELPVFARRLNGREHVLAIWPQSSAGNYDLHLRATDIDEQRLVTIWPSKLDRTAFSCLLEDLDSRLPTAIALSLKRLGALGGVKILPAGYNTLAQELLRLRRAVEGIPGRPGLVRVLTALADEPYQVLDGVERWVRRGQARRPHPARLVQSLTRADNLDAHMHPRRVIDERVEHHVDVYENRMLKSYYQQVFQRLLRVNRLLTTRGDVDLLDGDLGASALLEKLRRARKHAGFLDEVSLPAHLPTRITMVLLNHPAYRATLDGFLEFRRMTTVRLDDARVEAPLDNLPSLYQAWGSLHVLQVVLDAGAWLGYVVQRQDIVRRDAEGLYIKDLPVGRPIAILYRAESSTIVKVTLEQSFGGRGPLRSVSFTQRPDVSLEIVEPGRPDRVYLFDPKYKLDGEFITSEPYDDPLCRDGSIEEESVTPNRAYPRPKKVDIDKMHAYRDAIRDELGHRVVEYAGILYPGPTMSFGYGIEALAAIPGRDKPLLSRLEDIIQAAMMPVQAGL